jgi:hypothetical protein
MTYPPNNEGVGFDLDGTLTEPFSATPYPEALLWLALLRRRVSRIFVATNQAGSVYRAMTGDPKYPTADMLAEQLVRAATALSLADVPWYVATWHGNRYIYDKEAEVVGAWAKESGEQCEQLGYALHRLDPGLEVYVHGSPHWRKPEWGMLDAAVQNLGISFGALTYVGDHQTDHDAARDFGAAYVDAAKWRDGLVQL